MGEAIQNRRASDKSPGGNALSIEARLANGDERMSKLEAGLAANTEVTKEVLEIVTMGKSFFRVLGYIGHAIKWIAGIAAAVGAAWAAWHHK